MKINKIPKGTLRTIVREVISSAKNLGVRLDDIRAEMGEREGNVGSVHFSLDYKEFLINYFRREGEVVFCNVKEGEDKLVDKIYNIIGINHPGFTVCYVP